MGRSWALRVSGGAGAEGWIEETGLSSDHRENRQSLALAVSLNSLIRMPLLSLEKRSWRCCQRGLCSRDRRACPCLAGCSRRWA